MTLEKVIDFILQNKPIVKQIIFILMSIQVIFMLKGKIIKIDLLGILGFCLMKLYLDIHKLLSKTGVIQAKIELFSRVYSGFLFIYMITLIILFQRHLKLIKPDDQAEGIKNKFKTEWHFKIAVVEAAMFLLMFILW